MSIDEQLQLLTTHIENLRLSIVQEEIAIHHLRVIAEEQSNQIREQFKIQRNQHINFQEFQEDRRQINRSLSSIIEYMGKLDKLLELLVKQNPNGHS